LEKISHCRFTPIVFSLGYQFIKTDSKVITQAERKKTAWLFKKTENKPRDFQNHKTRCAEVILKNKIEKPVVVVKTTTHINSKESIK
jgi:hypothetical protein